MSPMTVIVVAVTNTMRDLMGVMAMAIGGHRSTRGGTKSPADDGAVTPANLVAYRGAKRPANTTADRRIDGVVSNNRGNRKTDDDTQNPSANLHWRILLG